MEFYPFLLVSSTIVSLAAVPGVCTIQIVWDMDSVSSVRISSP